MHCFKIHFFHIYLKNTKYITIYISNTSIFVYKYFKLLSLFQWKFNFIKSLKKTLKAHFYEKIIKSFINVYYKYGV